MQMIINLWAIVFMIGGLSIGCGPPSSSEESNLTESIRSAVSRLGPSAGSKEIATYRLNVGPPTVVAILDRRGLEGTTIPDGITPDMRARLNDAAQIWTGHAFIAIAWENGLSAGPSIERILEIPHPMVVVKSDGTVVVDIERTEEGTVRLAGLR